jgi:hypothetical protein
MHYCVHLPDSPGAQCGSDTASRLLCVDNQTGGKGSRFGFWCRREFYWKVSSQLGGDYLEFLIDSVRQARISGPTDWLTITYGYDPAARNPGTSMSKPLSRRSRDFFAGIPNIYSASPIRGARQLRTSRLHSQ